MMTSKEVIYSMGKLFNLDNSVMRFLTKIADLCILNIIFIISCVPIITIGPAIVALYFVSFKMVKSEESYMFRSYLVAFKENFKIGIKAGLVMLSFLAILYFSYRFATMLDESWRGIFNVTSFLVLFPGMVMSLFLFPYIARFKANLVKSIRNAMLIGIASLPYTMILFIILVIFVAFLLLLMPTNYVGLILITCWFSLLAFVQSFVFRKIFKKYEGVESNCKTKE